MPPTTKPTTPNARHRYKVFISSTYLDNKERRQSVQDATTMAGMVWHGMEIFTASTRPTVEKCRDLAEEADVLVGIIAWRYGWEPEGQDKSITEIEYDAAKERLMFLLDRELPVNPESDFDPGSKRWKKQDKLEAFIKKFSDDQMPTFFREETLQAKVLAALQEWQKEREPQTEPKPAPKTESGPPPDSDLNAQIKAYSQKAESLHATLPVAGFATQIKLPIDIEDIYVPLRAVLDLRGIDGESFADAAHADKILRDRDAGLKFPFLKPFNSPKNASKEVLSFSAIPDPAKPPI